MGEGVSGGSMTSYINYSIRHHEVWEGDTEDTRP